MFVHYQNFLNYEIFFRFNSTLYIDICDYEINGIICNPNLVW